LYKLSCHSPLALVNEGKASGASADGACAGGAYIGGVCVNEACVDGACANGACIGRVAGVYYNSSTVPVIGSNSWLNTELGLLVNQ
jgi:hypothetical protein